MSPGGRVRTPPVEPPPPAESAAGSALIVEEKPICREALWRLLQSCGLGGRPQFARSADAVADCDLSEARLAIVDLFTINYDFGRLARLIATAGPRPVVVLDDRANPAFSELAASAGAAAYVSKDQPLETMRDLFDAALSGVRPPRDTAAARPAARPGPRRLTQRQREVLAQLGQGLTNREIASLLRITPGTVKLHIHQILRITGARNRTEAALISARFLAVPQPPADA